MPFVYFLIFSVITATGIGLGGIPVSAFMNFLGMTVVGVSILVLVLAGGRWADFSRGMRHFFAFRRSTPANRPDAARIARFFRTLSSVSLAIGGFWSLVGVIIIVADMDPDNIGPGMAVALLTLFYTCFLSLTVFIPISLYYAGLYDAEDHKSEHEA
jgi:flagellar motor component MotA